MLNRKSSSTTTNGNKRKKREVFVNEPVLKSSRIENLNSSTNNEKSVEIPGINLNDNEHAPEQPMETNTNINDKGHESDKIEEMSVDIDNKSSINENRENEQPAESKLNDKEHESDKIDDMSVNIDNKSSINENGEKPNKTNDENPENKEKLNKTDNEIPENEEKLNKTDKEIPENEEKLNKTDNEIPENEEKPNKTVDENPENEEKLNKTDNESTKNGENSSKTVDETPENGENSSKTDDETPEISIPVLQHSEFYLSIGYARRNKDKEQYYAKDIKNQEIYFTDTTEEEIYAHKMVKVGDKEQKIEYPAVTSDGKPNYIYDRGVPRYPENLDTLEVIFPRDPITNEEIYLENLDGRLTYPTNKIGQQFYRKDLNNNDVPITDYTYARDWKGLQIYPKMSNGDQFYLTIEGTNSEIGASQDVNGENVQYYARKANGDEIYPRYWIPKFEEEKFSSSLVNAPTDDENDMNADI